MACGLCHAAMSAEPSAAAPAVRLSALPGWVIFAPGKEAYGYRYGPALIQNSDGSLDVWLASPGGKADDGTGQWDWIRYKHSPDGGKTWGPADLPRGP